MDRQIKVNSDFQIMVKRSKIITERERKYWYVSYNVILLTNVTQLNGMYSPYPGKGAIGVQPLAIMRRRDQPLSQ